MAELLVPAAQSTQAVEPAAVLYEPAVQDTHVSLVVAPTAALEVPAAHWVQVAAPAVAP